MVLSDGLTILIRYVGTSTLTATRQPRDVGRMPLFRFWSVTMPSSYVSLPRAAYVTVRPSGFLWSRRFWRMLSAAVHAVVDVPPCVLLIAHASEAASVAS